MQGTKYQLFITDDDSHSIRLGNSNITYHSTRGAIQEARHVFITAGLEACLNKNEEPESVSVLEVGFGTGLNALLTGLKAEETQKQVHYISIDPFPLPKDIFSQLNYGSLLQSERLYHNIMDAGWETVHAISPNFSLKKVKAGLADIVFHEKFDVIYFDAFAPEDQPEMWEVPIFEKLWEALNPAGFLTTYCSKSQVRRNLKTVGFLVEKLPGPPGKREIIRAYKKLS